MEERLWQLQGGASVTGREKKRKGREGIALSLRGGSFGAWREVWKGATEEASREVEGAGAAILGESCYRGRLGSLEEIYFFRGGGGCRFTERTSEEKEKRE